MISKNKTKGFYCLYKLASYNEANGVLQLAAQALKREIHPNIKMYYCSQLIVWGAIKSPKQFCANSASVALWQAESEGKTKPNMPSTNGWHCLQCRHRTTIPQGVFQLCLLLGVITFAHHGTTLS